MTTPKEFKRDVQGWAEKIGVKNKIRQIQLRKMKRKWASCSSKGRLTFEPSILEKPSDFRDGIILHELLHLRYPNHGKMFKLLLGAYLRR